MHAAHSKYLSVLTMAAFFNKNRTCQGIKFALGNAIKLGWASFIQNLSSELEKNLKTICSKSEQVLVEKPLFINLSLRGPKVEIC